MSKSEKLIKKWRRSRPREVRLQEIQTLLNKYFPGQWDWEGGSHIVIRSEFLKKFPAYQPFGEISIPVKSGKKVKWYYTRDLLEAISVIEDFGKETQDE